MLTIAAEPVPITIDENGTARVGGTRLTLDTVVARFDQGDTPEQIAESFPLLSVADAYAVITYVLRHRAEVDAYLQKREEQADRIQATIEANQEPREAFRARRLARWEKMRRGA